MGTGNGNGNGNGEWEWERGMGMGNGDQGSDNREYIKGAQITFMQTDNASTVC